jgi:hypothetical protein
MLGVLTLRKNLDPRVRLQAVEKMTEQRELAEVARTDDSPRVRMAAVARVQEDELLAEVAKDAREMDVRLAAVERISSQRLLAEIIRVRKNYQLMGACFARISDPDVLSDIAGDPAYNPAARRMAVEQFADESYLADVSDLRPDGTEEKGPMSPEAIETLLERYGGTRVVRAIGRFRHSEKALRALGIIASRSGESGGLAVEYLCRALGSANPALRRCATEELAGVQEPEVVAHLVRALDDPKLCEPIREVLERIDTPEARAALGQSSNGE